MAAVFCCGWECGLQGAVGQHWITATGYSFSTTTVRNGARSLRFNPSAATGTLDTAADYMTATAVKVWRFAVRFATLPDADTMLVFGRAGVQFPGVAFKSSDSKLYAANENSGTISFGASGVSVTTGTWYYVDIKADTTNDTVDVQVNGSACGQLSGLSLSSFTLIRLGSSKAITADMFFDDIIISETGGDYPFGDGYVNHFVPTSDGTHNVAGANDFDRTLTGTDITNSTTDAYTLVDAIPLIATDISADACITITAPPNATDYVQCVFGPAPGISTPTTGPRAVEVITSLQTASAGGTPTMDLSVRINDNGTIADIYTDSLFYNPDTPIFKRAHFATAPSTGAAWTSTLFNALQVRFGSFDAADSAPDGYFGATMVEAEFAEVVVMVTDAEKAAAAATYGAPPFFMRTRVIAYIKAALLLTRVFDAERNPLSWLRSTQSRTLRLQRSQPLPRRWQSSQRPRRSARPSMTTSSAQQGHRLTT